MTGKRMAQYMLKLKPKKMLGFTLKRKTRVMSLIALAYMEKRMSTLRAETRTGRQNFKEVK